MAFNNKKNNDYDLPDFEAFEFYSLKNNYRVPKVEPLFFILTSQFF